MPSQFHKMIMKMKEVQRGWLCAERRMMSTAFAEEISRPQNLSSDQDDDQGADEKINVDYQESMWKIGRESWP